MFHFIFDYNYGNLWQILIIFLPQKNRNEYSTKCVQTVSLQPDHVSTLPGQTKMTQKQPTAYTVHSVELIVPDFWRKSFNVRFFRIC